MSKEGFKKTKELLYKMHNYDPSTGAKNIHHIIFKSEGGTNDIDNLSLLDKDFHKWIHTLIDRMDRYGGELTKEEIQIINEVMKGY